MHAYAINADIAVIAPLINPSEKIANNIIANTNTMVYPKFFTNVDKIFSSVFIIFPFVVHATLYHIFDFLGSKKNAIWRFFTFAVVFCTVCLSFFGGYLHTGREGTR